MCIRDRCDAGFAERSGERRGGMKGNHWFIAGIIVFLVLMFAIEDVYKRQARTRMYWYGSDIHPILSR